MTAPSISHVLSPLAEYKADFINADFSDLVNYIASRNNGSSAWDTVVVGSAALATTATDGFLYIPTCAGAPTGVPTAHLGTVAMVFDTTNNKIMIYDTTWLGVVVA